MAFEHTGRSPGDTGRIYEARFLGAAEVDDGFARALEALPPGERRLFNSDDAVLELYRRYYKGDPKNPQGVHAKALYRDVAEALGLTKEELDRLGFYSTLGIPEIDHVMGIDGFFDLRDLKAGRRRVTIDVTMQEEKDSPKADIVIGELPDAVQEAKAYREAIHEYARLIARRLMPTLPEQPPKKQPPQKPAPSRRRIVV